jgi:hypothetical protein
LALLYLETTSKIELAINKHEELWLLGLTHLTIRGGDKSFRILNLLFASTSAGANRSYYGSSYTSINIYSRFSLSPYGYYTLAV